MGAVNRFTFLKLTLFKLLLEVKKDRKGKKIRYFCLRNPIFSPDAGGSINPKILQIVIIKHGIMKLNEKNKVLLRK